MGQQLQRWGVTAASTVRILRDRASTTFALNISSGSQQICRKLACPPSTTHYCTALDGPCMTTQQGHHSSWTEFGRCASCDCTSLAHPHLSATTHADMPNNSACNPPYDSFCSAACYLSSTAAVRTWQQCDMHVLWHVQAWRRGVQQCGQHISPGQNRRLVCYAHPLKTIPAAQTLLDLLDVLSQGC